MSEPAAKRNNTVTLETLRPHLKEKETLSDRIMPRRHPFILFDPEKCTGCTTCEMVCSQRNVLKVAPLSASVAILRDEEKGKNFAVLCQHCRKPLCIEACPTRAIDKGEDGIVRIDKLFCVECGLCIMACPEAAPLRDHKTKGINKCDLCDGDPLCVKYCPEKALTFTRGKGFRWIKGLRWTVQLVSFLLLVMILVGTFCSFTAGGISLACPTGVLQNIASSRTIVLVGIASAFVLLVLTVLAGRLFCGWICPFGFILDLVDKVIPKRLGWPKFLENRMTKYGVLAGAVGGSYALGFQAFCTVCPIGTLCRSYGVQGFFKGAELAIVPALAGLEIGRRRAWCRYFCPVGAVLGIVATLRLVKIVIGAKKCKKFSCVQCAEVCPVGIIDGNLLREGVSPNIPMTECIMCMRCVDRCPYDAAKIRFRWQKGVPGVPKDTTL
ncbi:MAG: 4Fe-4S binding protein [Deltaproteobacteria bacterium]|nr:4Fe-4S binding protein [Deltaproteobacteria bacterium]